MMYLMTDESRRILSRPWGTLHEQLSDQATQDQVPVIMTAYAHEMVQMIRVNNRLLLAGTLELHTEGRSELPLYELVTEQEFLLGRLGTLIEYVDTIAPDLIKDASHLRTVCQQQALNLVAIRATFDQITAAGAVIEPKEEPT